MTQVVANKGFSKRMEAAIEHYQLKERRLNLSQEDLAGVLGVSQGTVSNWRRGLRPTVDAIERAARTLGVSPGWLAFGEGVMIPALDAPVLSLTPSEIMQRAAEEAFRAARAQGIPIEDATAPELRDRVVEKDHPKGADQQKPGKTATPPAKRRKYGS